MLITRTTNNPIVVFQRQFLKHLQYPTSIPAGQKVFNFTTSSLILVIILICLVPSVSEGISLKSDLHLPYDQSCFCTISNSGYFPIFTGEISSNIFYLFLVELSFYCCYEFLIYSRPYFHIRYALGMLLPL